MLQSPSRPLHTQLTTRGGGGRVPVHFFLFIYVAYWSGFSTRYKGNFRKLQSLLKKTYSGKEQSCRQNSNHCALWIMHQFQVPAKSQTLWFPFENWQNRSNRPYVANSSPHLQTSELTSHLSLWGWKSPQIRNLKGQRCLFCIYVFTLVTDPSSYSRLAGIILVIPIKLRREQV